LDAGCGAGADLPLLQKSYPAAQILGIDAAEAMLHAAQGPGAKPLR
jgi:malonyl-CoA O-methyltransferase